jgi:cyclopropane fatty-acyl-phospholipid synthase-like methyltransferase
MAFNSMHVSEDYRPQPDDVARYYDDWTAAYLEAFGDCIQAHRPTREEDLLEYLCGRIAFKTGMEVLDAGCGVCGPARYFVGRVDIHIEAVTISQVQAEMAARMNLAKGLGDRIAVRIGDFHRLTEIYGRNVFDVVYFLESLSHTADFERALRSAYEVLKPGGWVYIKDFFIRRCGSEAEQQDVLGVVSRVDRIFAVKTAWAHEVLRTLRTIGFMPVFVEKPRFDVDNTRWQYFERKHQFDLFAGRPSFDWSQWWEIKFCKACEARQAAPIDDRQSQ